MIAARCRDEHSDSAVHIQATTRYRYLFSLLPDTRETSFIGCSWQTAFRNL